MALNNLGMKEASESARAKTYLISKQQSDGGFLSWSGSDSTTTAQALIALSGKQWLLKVFNATSSATPSATPSAIPTSRPTATGTPIPNPTPMPASPTPKPAATSLPSPLVPKLLTQTKNEVINTPNPIPKPSPQILGETISPKPITGGFKDILEPVGVVFSLFAAFKFLEGRRWIK